MQRRQFLGLLSLLGGAASAWPLAAWAQAAKAPKLVMMIPGSKATHGKWSDAVVQRLAELGWTGARPLTVETRWAEGHPERYGAMATELAVARPDVIFAPDMAAVMAVRQAAPATPVVFAGLTDPVGNGVVASLRRPGGNATGLSGQSFELGSKRIGLLAEAMPQLRRLAVLRNGSEPATAQELAAVQSAARVLGIKVSSVEVKTREEIVPAIAALKDKAQAVYVVNDPLMLANYAQIGSAALDARLPTMDGQRDYVTSGGLMSYGADIGDLYRRAGDVIDKILRGTKPATLPVQAPTKFELVVNMKTAKTLGLTMPPLLVKRADEVIEG